MRLKRLLCRGFKSFADNTEFDFETNLTGIVGPNGCGKSNVVDAVKWVLGDQRARSLRGEEMTDVIFKGAEGRDAMPAAEVTIVLEDETGAVDGRTEVSIGRRLTRDKESSYLLNGESVRLKDVRGAMMDTGLGVGAYSVMEQGRIDAVLSANPEDRRAIFEEAAGISRFKQQKRESLRKLDRTEQNLARVIDLLEERGKRIRSLKIQASKARRYAELRDQLRDQRAAQAVLESRRLRTAEEEQRTELERLEAEQVAAELEVTEMRGRLTAAEGRIREEELAGEEVQEQLHEARRVMDSARTRADALGERSAERLADAESAAARCSGLEEQRVERQAGLDEARGRLAGLEQQLQHLETELATRSEAVAAQQRRLDDLGVERERARARMLEWIHRKTQARNRAHDQEAQIRAVRAREQRLDERGRALVTELSALDEERARYTRERDEVVRQSGELRGEEERVRDELAAAEGEAAELGRREAALREQLSAVAGQVRLLAEVERQMEGVDRGPRYLLEHRPEGLRGRLLDVLDVDLRYGPALEAALGGMVQALVVDTREHAAAMFAELAAGNHGRAALLVEEEFSDELAATAEPELPPGMLPLASVVRCDDRARALVRWLLRGVCLVDSPAEARSDRLDLCFVTMTGELLWGPRLEGGHGEGHGGLIVRKAQMHQLSEEETSLRTELEDLQQGKEVVVGRVETLVGQTQALSDQLQRLVAEEQTRNAEVRRLDGRCEDLRRERETLTLESTEVREQGMAARAELGRHLLDELLLVRLERRESEAEEAAGRALAAAQDEARHVREAEQEVRLRQVGCRADREALGGTIQSHERGLEDLAKTATELQERESSARAAAAQAQEEAECCAEEAVEQAERLAELEAQRAERVAALTASQGERETEQKQLAESDARRSRQGEAITALRLELADLEHRFARVEDRLREETAIELRRCLGEVEGLGLVERSMPGPFLPEEGVTIDVLEGPPMPPAVVEAQTALARLWENEDFDETESRRFTQVLQAKVDRLGHVNLDAVRELDETETSYQFLEQEVADLKESRKSLMETLRRLETESRALFEATFEEARKNFQSIFRKLFQGGRADMQLVEGEDTLEAGIDITAKPPGKELQSINLLSGGERSLTALAILFAVFKVKPSPFCILDEVDAALDDTNVERFLRVLRDFVGPTQFCIVTHHKRTMAECQKLYGITMQRRGVSSRIAVSLDEVDRVTGDSEGTGPGRLRTGTGRPPAASRLPTSAEVN